MKKIIISVIIPTYNEEKNLPACLKSLKNQKTEFPFEVIVVDYNSTDQTRSIVKQNGYKLIIEKRPGRAAARNSGASAAKGEILAFTEADCILSPNWIEEIGKHLQENPTVIGLTGIYSFYESTPFYNLLAEVVLNSNEFFYYLIFRNHSFRGTNLVIRKQILNQAGGFKYGAAPADDFDLGLRIRKLGPIHFLPQLKIKTSDRRLRGRLLIFLKEFFSTYYRVFILKKRGFEKSFAVIR